jgi:hypothetical protein
MNQKTALSMVFWGDPLGRELHYIFRSCLLNKKLAYLDLLAELVAVDIDVPNLRA